MTKDGVRKYPKPIYVDLIDENKNVPQPVICRTCTRSNDRFWMHNKLKRTRLIAQGVSNEELMCAPERPWGSFKVLNTVNWRERIVPLKHESDTPTRAIVDTCGQDIRKDCAQCDRFSAITVDVAYTSSPDGKVTFKVVERRGADVTVPYSTDGSPVKYWKVVVGGHCSIPAEGMVTDGGVRKFCDFQPRKKRVESPSCANCFYLDYKGQNWQFDHLEVNANASLTPYERSLVGTDPMEIGLALYHKQTDPIGRHYWFDAEILATKYHNGRKYYRVKFAKSQAKAIIAEADDRFYVHELEGDKAAVDILYPYNKMFRLEMPTRKHALIWPELPESILVERDLSHLVKDTCCDCKGKVPCYYHSKIPYRNSSQDTTSFHAPDNKRFERVYPPQRQMHVVKRQGVVVAVDGNDNLPAPYSNDVANASVFRASLSGLLASARRQFGAEGVKAIQAQYAAVTGGLKRSVKPTPYRPSWLKPSTIEPNKSYCSHPDGLDLRKVFRDSFGSERVDWDFDHGEFNTTQVEEELRVGYRQHSQTPQRLQEEILANDASHELYDPASDSVKFAEPKHVDEFRVIQIESIGDMTRDDGSPVTDPREFADGLDTIVTIGHSGAVERKMTKRQQLYGYDVSKGFIGNRKAGGKTTLPHADPDFIIFDTDDKDPEQIDIIDAWACPECYKEYDQSEVEDFFDPKCTECGSALYRNHTTRQTYNPRSGGGIGNAFAMSSPYMQERARLYNTVCPHWRLNAQTVITLDDVYGPSADAPATTVSVRVTEHIKVIKVDPGKLTDEMLAVNKAFDDAVNEIARLREEHLNKFPDVTPEELQKLFPPHSGTVYRERLAGSLSKMGGV